MVTTYDAAGRKTADTNPNLHTTLYEYDVADRLVTIKAPYSTGTISATTILDYDAANRKTKETDPNGRQTRFDYDYRGRLITTTYPTLTDGTVLSTTQSYDGAGNLQQKKDQAGKPTTYGYDTANRLTSVTNALSQVTSYRYDPVGHLLEIKDAKSQRTQFEYDLWGRQTKKMWPDGAYEQYGYDEVSNRTVVTTTQVTGQTAQVNSFTYNKLNQLTQASYFDGRSVNYSYTLSGQRYQVTDSLWGTTSYSYDQRERVTAITGPNVGGSGRSIAYKYDGLGNRTVMTATANTTNLVTNYTYDNAERLRTVSNATHFAGSATYDYDKVGLRSQLALPNGVNVTYSYDELNRLTNLTQTNSGGNLASYTYQLGLAGNRTKVTELGGNSVEWGYDDTYRLTNETRKNSGGAVLTTTNFLYDTVGNRQKQTITAGSSISITNYSYNELDQLKILLSGGVSTGYSYDRRGNLMQAGTSSYGFDAADRMISATLQAGSATYLYDHDNRRVKQIAGGNTTYYLWDELSRYSDVALETDGSNNVTASYALGGGELLSQKKSSTVSYFLMDGHSGVRGLTNSGGAISESYKYDAFGTLQNGAANPATNYLYTGQQFDTLTQLYNLRARYYNSFDGRFLTQDTATIKLEGPLELNRYGYVANNPVNLIDPSGYVSTAPPPAISPPASPPASPNSGRSNRIVEYLTILTLVAGATIASTTMLGRSTECACQRIISILLAATKNGAGLIAMEATTPPDCMIPVIKFRTMDFPYITNHIWVAQYARMKPMLLRCNGPGNAQSNQNRKGVCDSKNIRDQLRDEFEQWNPNSTVPRNQIECDEYPFASTMEGGIPGNPGVNPGTPGGPSRMGVPAAENSRSQGPKLSNFYAGRPPDNRTGRPVMRGEYFATVALL